MSEQATAITPTPEVPKKRRGAPKGGWPKKDKPAVETVRSEIPAAMAGEALERFVYQSSPGEMDAWEADETRSATHVPKEIRDAYPNLRFHWSSKGKWDRVGKNYNGWQRFSDKQLAPEGLTRGNDLFLTAMPEERAQRYQDKVSEESIARIRSSQEKSLNFQIGQGLSKEEMEKMGLPEGTEAGIMIGVRPKTKTRFGNRVITGGGYTRGMSREEAREHVRKEIADRKKNRVYSFGKR